MTDNPFRTPCSVPAAGACVPPRAGVSRFARELRNALFTQSASPQRVHRGSTGGPQGVQRDNFPEGCISSLTSVAWYESTHPASGGSSLPSGPPRIFRGEMLNPLV
eukprot:1181710-Prorocentrum_minimum.AAC.2